MSEKVKWQNSRDYKLEDCKYKDKLKDIRVLTINLLDYKGIVYDGTNKYETYLSMLTAESYEEMEKIIGHLKEGKIETTTSIAKNLLNMGLSTQDVMKATGLSKKQLTMLM